jgi:hypothetical protein
MDKAVSATDATAILPRRSGSTRRTANVTTSHGTPGATIAPAHDHLESEGHGRAALLERLHSGPVVNIGPWTRDELYEDAP